jgi:hypothetical protein
MEEFPGNSHKNTNPKVDKKAPGKKAAQPKIGEEKEKLKKVVSGEVITKKPPLLHRVKDFLYYRGTLWCGSLYW